MSELSLRSGSGSAEVELRRRDLRKLVVRVAAAAGCGVLLGLVVYTLWEVEDRLLFSLLGAIAGAAVASLAGPVRRNVNLTEMTVVVPPGSQLTFQVDNDGKQTAWELFIEVTTRVATQPLGQEEGFLREALDSLYALFGRTRQLLAQSRPSNVSGGKTVEYLALTMLNRELRPFLSRWHPRLTRFERSGEPDEAAWEDNAAFREELEAMRGRLLEFGLSFARLAGVSDPGSVIETRPYPL